MNILNYVIAILSFCFGIGSIITFTIFLYTGPLHILTLPFTTNELLIFNATLAMLFFLQHSLMVRMWFKSIAYKFIPDRYFAAVFSIISGLFLFTLIILWQESSITIIVCKTSCYWLIRSAFFATLLLQGWALWTLKEADLFGIKALIEPTTLPLSPEMEKELILMTGAYKLVRHPIYSTSILLLWLYPYLTVDRLLLNLLFTGWIIIGAKFEERDLIKIHGAAYKKYQNIVPMLFPRILRFKD